MDKISMETAIKLIAVGTDMAKSDYGRPICVAIVDAHGDAIASVRMDGAPVRSVAICQGKAYSAARMGVNTDAFLERLQREGIHASDFCDPKIVALPGGAIVEGSDGTLIGAIGISGLKSEEDQAIVTKMISLIKSNKV